VPATGAYFWRVASRDARGLEGEFGFARRFAVVALPGDEPVAVDDADADEADEEEPEPPPSTATEVEFDFAGQVMGQGLRRQARGRGTFRPISGRVELSAQDVLRAERWGGVRLGRDASVQLDPDSQVQLSRAGRDGGRRVLALGLSEGSVVTDLGGNAALASVLVEADGARVTVRGEGDGTRIRTTRMEDRLRVITERGETRVWAGGREHRVPPAHALDIPKSGEIGPPRPLPRNPVQSAPAAGAAFTTLDSPPAIVMTWQPVETAMAYRVRITAGNRLVYQGNTQQPRLAHNALQPGTYQWRVHAVDRTGLESVDPPARTFTVARESRPPQVTVLSPADGSTVSVDQVTVAGRTEAGVRVKVNGRDVDLDGSGSFSTNVRLTPGVNHIVIEAVNRANAVTFENLRIRRE
jgi:hypothetical protein